MLRWLVTRLVFKVKALAECARAQRTKKKSLLQAMVAEISRRTDDLIDQLRFVCPSHGAWVVVPTRRDPSIMRHHRVIPRANT